MIVSYKDFVEKYQMQCDFVLVGPCQAGSIEGRESLSIPVCPLDFRWFVG